MTRACKLIFQRPLRTSVDRSIQVMIFLIVFCYLLNVSITIQPNLLSAFKSFATCLGSAGPFDPFLHSLMAFFWFRATMIFTCFALILSSAVIRLTGGGTSRVNGAMKSFNAFTRRMRMLGSSRQSSASLFSSKHFRYDDHKISFGLRTQAMVSVLAFLFSLAARNLSKAMPLNNEAQSNVR